MGWRAGICHDCVTPSCQEWEIHRFPLHRAISRRSLWEHAFDGRHEPQGQVAEAVIAAEAIKLGVPVLRPISEHGRYDLIFDLSSRLLRVQCKWGNRKGGVVAANLGGNYLSPSGYVRSTYGTDEIDAIAIYCGALDECYLLPIALVEGQSTVHLRLTPARNGQRAGLHFASDYSLSGAVAQLGERWRGTPEATGSSPVSSTAQAMTGPGIVGSHEFRCLFGWYAQQAAAGHEILFTRRGKPYVRLVPARDQPDLESAAGNGGSAEP